MSKLSDKMKECPWYGSTLDIMLSFRGQTTKPLEQYYPCSSYAWALKELQTTKTQESQS